MNCAVKQCEGNAVYPQGAFCKDHAGAAPSPSAAHAEVGPTPTAVPGQLHPHAGLLSEVSEKHIAEHWGGTDGTGPLVREHECAALECRLATALRSGSPSPCTVCRGTTTVYGKRGVAPEEWTLAMEEDRYCCWHCNGSGVEQSPSPGAVEAAYREGWRNAYENTDPELGGHGCDEYWLASAARRGAAGGQDG